MHKLMFAGELPVFVAGDHRQIVGRGTGYEEGNAVVLEIRLRKEMGLELIEALKRHVPLGLEIHFSPTREVKDVIKKEEPAGAAGAGAEQQPSRRGDQADGEAVRPPSPAQSGQAHEER